MSNWVRLPGKSRQYRDLDAPNSAPISRRQYDKLQQAAGKRKERDLVTAAKHRKTMGVFKTQRARYAKEHNMTKAEAGKSAGFKETMDGLYSRNKRVKTKALKELGLRDGIPDYVDPGMSDLWMKSGAKNKAQWQAIVKASKSK